MSNFTVTNLNSSGPGSLREAIELSNASRDFDTITFSPELSGVISLSNALPDISSPLSINALPTGQTAPSIQIDFAGNRGITFSAGSDGSSLIGLSLVGASGAALTLESSNNTVQNNYIGVDLDGQSASANNGDGITITASSAGNLIGSTTPGDSTSWNDLSEEGGYAISAIQGIRSASNTSDPYILCGSGTEGDAPQVVGLVSLGAADGSGEWFTVNAATAFGGSSSALTSCYGPEQLDANTIRLVGSYNSNGDFPPTNTSAFIYTGAIDQANGTTEGFTEYQHPDATWTFFHSTQEGLVVGNWDNTVTIPDTNRPIIGTGKAIIYEVSSGLSIADIAYPGSKSTTAYGIAKVNDDLFAITGSYSLDGEPDGVAHGYLVYYRRSDNSFSEWTSWDVNDVALGNIASHADGISYNSTDNTFTLATWAIDAATGLPLTGQLMTVQRTADGGFGERLWTEVNYNNQTGGTTVPTSVAGDVMTGEYEASDGSVTTWSSETSFFVDPSNVISGNGGNGIAILGSSTAFETNNTIAQNRIGTSADGSTALANGENGILINASNRNLIGGTLSGGNNPTKEDTTPPPLGNLISGNTGNGVLIRDGAEGNSLSGNFIGTTATGNVKLGNKADGVAILNADNNRLLGCQLESSPFIYYNVVSGNEGNGVRITNSDNSTIHANFFGLAANNLDSLGNGLNGALIEGDSNNTQYGGVIPLGNVNSGNSLNGIEVKDTASGFITFNTFAGTTAFGGIAPNQRNGMLFTSSGGDNTIRTNVIGGNIENGIHITGSAADITVDPNIIGLNTAGNSATYTYPSGEIVSYANGLDGIRVDGNAENISIAGTYRSVIPQNTISNNNGYGINVLGNAKQVQIANTAIGTGSLTERVEEQFGNTLGGIFVGGNTNDINLGDPTGSENVLIANNLGSGLTVEGRLNNQLSNIVFRNNDEYGLSFLGLTEAEAEQQINKGITYAGNAFGTVEVAPGWANLSLSQEVDTNSFSVAADTEISVLRQDTSDQIVNFGLRNQSTDTVLSLTQLNAASRQSLNLEDIIENTWSQTEGVALGGREISELVRGTWIPVATNQDNEVLVLENLTLAGDSATATFSGGIQAVYSVGGTGVLATAAAEPVATVTATIRRLSDYNNAIAIYESDALTGAVNGLLPGTDGYLEAALDNAKQAERVFSSSQLPGYDQTGTIEFSISTQNNYSFLILVDGNESTLYSSYAASNPGQSIQFTSFTTPGGGLTIGVEDLLATEKSDQDFNDLIISLPPMI
ncbi:putative galacturonase [Synechococcus sp. PROS-7-1]|uniref:beta strand repeat-containing protein n=1 Tax=Synechococcus sp. PROS-7-1 TaxID=1442556 RepID=UPI001647C316|nr:right-handed parallel beta-helix repeat-containing protein [Synechococcus sp. PROS-7-1]QNI84805.1 putative galacturonase [Synechococcus sp. PROS-7-1]